MVKKAKRKYSPAASKDVEREMRRYKRGSARSGPGGKGGKVKSRKQAIAIGLSMARKEGKKVPRKASARKASARKVSARKASARRASARKASPRKASVRKAS